MTRTPAMQGTQGRAFWVVEREQGELRTEALPAVTESDVRVRTRWSGISRGTELRVFRGQVPASERARMRAPHQAGDLPWPVKYGYCSVGDVSEGPASLVGKQVFCLYPHQDQYVVPAEAVLPLPEGVPARRAVLAANLETALNAIWDAEVRVGDRVTVVGAGVVGALVTYLVALHPGTEVQVIELDQTKAELIERLGARFALPAQAVAGADIVIHASGSPEGLRTALELAGKDATVLELSFYGDEPVTLPLGAAFHSQRLCLRSSQVGGLPRSRLGRFTPKSRLALALTLLRDDRLDALLEPSIAFERLPAFMAELSRGRDARFCQVVEY